MKMTEEEDADKVYSTAHLRPPTAYSSVRIRWYVTQCESQYGGTGMKLHARDPAASSGLPSPTCCERQMEAKAVQRCDTTQRK